MNFFCVCAATLLPVPLLLCLFVYASSKLCQANICVGVEYFMGVGMALSVLLRRMRVVRRVALGISYLYTYYMGWKYICIGSEHVILKF